MVFRSTGPLRQEIKKNIVDENTIVPGKSNKDRTPFGDSCLNELNSEFLLFTDRKAPRTMTSAAKV